MISLSRERSVIPGFGITLNERTVKKYAAS